MIIMWKILVDAEYSLLNTTLTTDKLVPWQGHAWHDIRSEPFEQYPLEKCANASVSESNEGFFRIAGPICNAIFCFCIFLMNYGSYRYTSLGIFYLIPTKNLAVQRFGAVYKITCIIKICCCFLFVWRVWRKLLELFLRY